MTSSGPTSLARPASQIADRVAQRARGTDAFVNKLERLYARRSLTRMDLERAYTGGFLSFVGAYEKAWEDRFVGLLMGRLTVSPPARKLVDIHSEVVARSVLLGNRDYLDWLPIDRTVRRAEIYFSSGHPFSLISEADRGLIRRHVYVRHALARDSRYSTRQFQRKVIGQRVLPPHERRPAGYLRGAHAAGQTRMNLALAELTVILGRVCA